MGDASRGLLEVDFGQDGLTGVRHAVANCAAEHGLSGQALDDFVFVVNELTTNAVRHGGGSGRLTLWLEDGRLHCQISDKGPGLPGDRINGSHLPPSSSAGGRGLWLVRHLSNARLVSTTGQGTTIALSANLGP
jgi:anti-sigma regulatory factor (Ser/Thr protein kinase)